MVAGGIGAILAEEAERSRSNLTAFMVMVNTGLPKNVGAAPEVRAGTIAVREAAVEAWADHRLMATAHRSSST